jgi:cyclophilin family peptidyl-prolyl cis-trans isomerase
LTRVLFTRNRLRQRVTLGAILCAGALLQGCDWWRVPHATADPNAALLQRMLAAEDMRGTGPEGTAPLLEGGQSADATIRRVAVRGLERLHYTAAPAAPRPARSAERPPAEPCARVVRRVHDANPRVLLAAIDSLAFCTEDGTARIDTLRAIAASLKMTDVPRAFGHVTWHAPAHALIALARVPGGAVRVDRAFMDNFLRNPRPEVRAYAVRAAVLFKFADIPGNATRDDDPNVQAEAIAAMVRLKIFNNLAFTEALASPAYQVVLAGANALAGESDFPDAVPALYAAMDRLSREQRENSRDERVAILTRIAELGTPADSSRLTPYLADFDTTVAAKTAVILTKWSGHPVTPHAQRLSIIPGPLADVFNTRGLQLRITMAPSSGGGTIVIDLFTDETPATIARVVGLANRHYYDGLTFHRVVPNFVIQGGSPGANEVVGDARFMRDELGGHSHLRGTVGISTRGHDTGDAQFFVNLVDNQRLDHDYTVFGKVVSGMNVVDQILEGDVMERVEVIRR